MKLEVQRLGSVTVLSPVGALALDDCDDFAKAVEEYHRKSSGRFVLEMSQVPVVDSRGIETLWDIADRQIEAGQTLKLAAVPELCREIFEITGLVEHLDLFDSSESAVRSFL